MRAWILAIALAACGSKKDPGPPIGVSGVSAPVAQFSYDSLDARPLSSDSMRGKVGVLAFITTYDLASQALMNFVVQVAKSEPRGMYGMVALQPRADRELVEQFRDTLNVTFPSAMADVAGTGFGEVRVPTVIVLDPAGKIAFRKEGIVKGDELRRAIESAAPAHP